MLRPQRTALMIEEMSSLIRIILAAYLAAGQPEPMAKPTLAAFRASISAKPSPVTATTLFSLSRMSPKPLAKTSLSCGLALDMTLTG